MSRKTDMPLKIRCLREFYAREHRVPSYREMLELLDYKSKNAVFRLVNKLAESGYLTKKEGKVAFGDKLTGSIRLLGAVQAGFPSPAEEELIDTLRLDEYLVERPEATYMLRVTGDSMIDAGIHPGDMVLVEKGKAPKSGDVVIACIDGEWTLKFFVKDKRGVRLEPANAKYHTIRPERSLELGGVVRTVIRKLC